MKRITVLTMLTALVALWTVTAWAGAPDSVNFQGRLRDGSGNPVTVATNVAYRIYDVQVGGAPLWGPETHNVTPDAGGLYNVTLGSLVSFPSNLFAGTPRYLGITIAADPEVTPRTQVVSVAYALRVKTVDGATGGTITGDVNITGKATIGPGNSNTGTNSFVAGENNAVSNFNSTISGGQNNTANGGFSTIGGGQANTASGLLATIGGGVSSEASASYATVAGGNNNIASAGRSTVGGGEFNRARGQYSVVAGGGGGSAADSNSALGDNAAIGGGLRNVASGLASRVGGGQFNKARGDYSVVGGGGGATAVDSNAALGINSSVGGGESNIASGLAATIAGGSRNIASTTNATVGGGSLDSATGFAATVPGGFNNKALGNYSFAAGRQAKAIDHGTFVWADISSVADFASTLDNQFLIRAAGGVGIGTNNPSSALHVREDIDGVAALTIENRSVGTGSQQRIDFVSEDGGAGTSSISVFDNSHPTAPATMRFANNLALGKIDFINAGIIRVAIDQAGNVGIGDATPNFQLDVEQSSNTVAAFNRTTTDGSVIAIQQDGITEGFISVAGGIVTYGAFTGSHYGWTEEVIERGELVSLTGVNRNSHDNPKSEIIYGIKRSTAANDPACLGSYLGLQESNQPAGSENSHLVMAVGNGDMWVADEGADIQPGDFLISSSLPGHAMKDDPDKYPLGYVIARAAEPVNWASVGELVGGTKHKRISVLFESFVRTGTTHLTKVVEQQQREIEELKTAVKALMAKKSSDGNQFGELK